MDAVYSQDLSKIRVACDDTSPVYLKQLGALYVRRSMTLFSTPPPAGMPPIQNPDITSLGRIDTYLNREHGLVDSHRVAVRDFWLGTEMLSSTRAV